MPILFLYIHLIDGCAFSKNNKIVIIENSGMMLYGDGCLLNAIPQMKGSISFRNGNSLNKVNCT